MSTGSERRRLGRRPKLAIVGAGFLLALGAIVVVRRELGRERTRERGATNVTAGEAAARKSPLERAEEPAHREREPVSSGDLVAPDPALDGIRELAARWRGRLSLAEPELDPALLEPLREAARQFDAATLLDAAASSALGSEEQCLYLLASAWARGLDAATDEQLAAFARDVEAPLEARDRAGLAAIHALSLGGRRTALGAVARDLVTGAWGAPEGQPVLPGLVSVRAWFALRDATLDPSHLAPVLDRGRTRYRVSHEAFALVAREAPEVFAPMIFERVSEGDESAREGLAALRDPRWLPELSAVLDAPATEGFAVWNRADAGRGLVAMATEASLARLTDELGLGGPRRGSALAALGSWRHTESWERLVALGETLEGDVEAHAAWRRGVERGWRRLQFRRDDDPERAAAAAALQIK